MKDWKRLHKLTRFSIIVGFITIVISPILFLIAPDVATAFQIYMVTVQIGTLIIGQVKYKGLNQVNV